jgi:phospholipid/cholesterol/gamma-HCH transport system permease protein
MHTEPPSDSSLPLQAALSQRSDGVWALSGPWTLQGLGELDHAQSLPVRAMTGAPLSLILDGSALSRLDSAGAWVLSRWLGEGSAATELRAWPPQAETLMKQVQQAADPPLAEPPHHGMLQSIGLHALDTARQCQAFLGFVGEVATAAAQTLRQRHLWRLRAVAHEAQVGGYEALPIIGLTSFLLGVVVAYQGADQLRHYGANVFVVELVGYAMLREFAPLIGAIIIAGRSGSAYAAQIGTMVVADEIDAMRAMGIDPVQRLVLPKLVALSVCLPLLTVFADLTGVFGGMVMARSRLDIGFAEFVDRFGRVMQGSTLLIGIGKSLVFAVIIALVGCFQGLRTQGSADSVGQQTTRSVVQSIFVVIVVDAVFSVAFNMLGI